MTLNIRYHLTMYKDGQLARKPFHSRKRGRVQHLARNTDWDVARIVVDYGIPNAINEAECTTADQLIETLAIFNEPALKAYLLGEEFFDEFEDALEDAA